MEARIQALRYIEHFSEFVTDVANHILHQRSGQADLVIGSRWTSRFLKRHGYFKKLQKKLHSERQASEDLTRVNQYFQSLHKVIQEKGIPPEDIWNMDETGFRIGVGKDQLVVTKRKRAHYFAIPENRESATAIEAISAGGAFIPAFLILSGQMHMTSWYQIPGLDPDTAIRPTSTGYSNDEISLEWLQHFDKHSAKTSRSSKRLLILDGHGSHHTRQFIQYCDEHGIIPFGMPPNLTHLLQPLDVVVFQPLKHYHAKALEVMVRDGLVNITKLEFLSCIQQPKGVKWCRKEEDQIAKARKVIEAAELKARSARRRWFEEAAKKARKWRASGRLPRVEICDSERGTRWLKRF
ncbi:DDE superfamily endonuclease [Hirsutella rhossiliensis]